MTTMKSVILSAALGLSTLTFASATTAYKLVLSQPSQAGKAQLAAGAYRLTVNGSIATFTNVETNRSVMLMIRNDRTAGENFDKTAVETKDENGVRHIESIELGDSNSKLEF